MWHNLRVPFTAYPLNVDPDCTVASNTLIRFVNNVNSASTAATKRFIASSCFYGQQESGGVTGRVEPRCCSPPKGHGQLVAPLLQPTLRSSSHVQRSHAGSCYSLLTCTINSTNSACSVHPVPVPAARSTAVRR
jgi:hypothetical protein